MLFRGLGDLFFISGFSLEIFSRTLYLTGDFCGVNICGILVDLEISGSFFTGEVFLSVVAGSNGLIAFLELPLAVNDYLIGLLLLILSYIFAFNSF